MWCHDSNALQSVRDIQRSLQEGTYVSICSSWKLQLIHASVLIIVHIVFNLQRNKPDQWCDKMEYRAKLTEYQFNLNIKQFNENVEVFRQLAIHESKYPDCESDHIGWLIAANNGRKPTIEEIQSFPKKKILHLFQRMTKDLRYEKFVQKSERRTKLLSCGNCGKEEDGMGQFNVCPRCKEVPYCGRSCQKEAWRMHKKICGKSK